MAPRRPNVSTFVMVGAFVFVVFIMFNNDLRLATGRVVGVVLDPIIGFNDAYPMWTIFFAGVLMILATTAIRHFLTDWVKLARVQEVMRQFQKEFSAARKENNSYKIKKLTDAQPQLMKYQQDLSTEQMKPMAFTMLFVIPIFAWLSTFLALIAIVNAAHYPGALSTTCQGPSIAVPWDAHWYLNDRDGNGGIDCWKYDASGAFVGVNSRPWWSLPFLPHWIMLYSLISIPFGQLTQRALKMWEYRRVDPDLKKVAT